jgi:hypothetical protein
MQLSAWSRGSKESHERIRHYVRLLITKIEAEKGSEEFGYIFGYINAIKALTMDLQGLHHA